MSLILSILFFPFCTSLDTLTPDQFIKDDQSLVTKGNNFALGFFSPGNSSYQYLGIWFVKVTKQIVVWVANRNDPINDSSGVLSINQFGNLVLHDCFNRLLWSTNVSLQGTTSFVAQLQDSGNLVLIQGNNKKVLWQSFDYPTNTLLPSMRLGLNQITGLDRFLTSWKSQDDPGTGDCIYKMNPNGSPQAFLYKGSILHRSAAWPWQTLSASARVSSGYEPQSPKGWYHRDGFEGCVKKNLGLSMCGNCEGTVKRKLHNQSLNFTSTKGSLEVYELEGSSRNPHLSIFNLSSIVASTDNFSPTNKLGQGGFGPVFKGQLSDGQQTVVKRLSKSSRQGIEEFKNEVVLIAKLQHRNLVKILVVALMLH
uniref:Uncharacterized protein n=1 Tax=Quercus lobata TaxID=97700 RepID=A0A7N2N0I3_QUELO